MSSSASLETGRALFGNRDHGGVVDVLIRITMSDQRTPTGVTNDAREIPRPLVRVIRRICGDRQRRPNPSRMSIESDVPRHPGGAEVFHSAIFLLLSPGSPRSVETQRP